MPYRDKTSSIATRFFDLFEVDPICWHSFLPFFAGFAFNEAGLEFTGRLIPQV